MNIEETRNRGEAATCSKRGVSVSSISSFEDTEVDDMKETQFGKVQKVIQADEVFSINSIKL